MKKAWMISTACAAVLAMTGMATAQGTSEHNGKGERAATHQSSGAAGQMNKSESNRAGAQGSAQNSEKSGASKMQSAQGAKSGRESTTGQGSNERNSAAEQKGSGAKSGAAANSNQRNEKSGAAMNRNERNEKSGAAMNNNNERNQKSGAAMNRNERNQKSGAAMNNNERNQKSGAAMNKNERNEKSGTAMGKERNNTRTGANEKAGSRSTTGSASASEVKLTQEQRTKIRNVVINEHKIPKTTHVNFAIRVGTKVPRSVHFYAVPEEIVRIHPAWASYKVIFVNDELVLIDPSTYEIVYIVTV